MEMHVLIETESICRLCSVIDDNSKVPRTAHQHKPEISAQLVVLVLDCLLPFVTTH